MEGSEQVSSKHLARWQDYWRDRQPRERTILGWGVVCVLAAVLYSVCFEPALSGREKLQKNLPAMRQQAAELQSLLDMAANPPPPITQAMMPLSPVTVAESLKKQALTSTQIDVQGNMIKIQFSGVAFFSVLDWLDQIHRNSRWQVKEASFTPQSVGVNASVTLGQL